GGRDPSADGSGDPPVTPPHDSAAGRAYFQLQKQARADARPVQEVFQLYILEAFLDRLSRSAYRDTLVLKGGVLLAAFGERRPTRDVDLQAHALSNSAEVVLKRTVEIVAIEIDDGVEFDTGSATAKVIRDQDAYAGVRVSMAATLLPAKHRFHVDVNVGDPIWPGPEDVRVPRLLGGEIIVKGYPLEMVHSEKIVTAVARGTVNTRWRDFMDVVRLAARHQVDGDTLVESVRDVAEHRGVELAPLTTVLDGYASIGQQKWAAWRRRQQIEDRVPQTFADVVAEFISFADPVIAGDARGRRWDPRSRSWQ
ncbi:MAG TPA: nucleotidyl transferase AbiEii/AbiGii toxin family protein, partial [Acidimicrobiales bacterium]|nr:nucleotidyl transferase AbiEii/AbiGii toxin family protein [Acidimicrobiales bacterium]